MIKKIKPSELVLGMYIHSLNADWSKHPFFRKRFLIKTEDQLQKIIDLDLPLIDIDTDKGLDVAPPPPLSTPESVPPPQAQPAPSTPTLPDKQRRRILPPEKISLRGEMTRARNIYGEASVTVQSMLIDARLGRPIELERMQPTIAAITGSVLRNPDAMISLFRVKQADKHTFQHSVAVSTLLVAFGQTLQLDRDLVEQAALGGLMHDIGKVKLPSYILAKPGKLTEAEYKLMQRHVEYGLDLMCNATGLSSVVLDVVGQHHERIDGSGYPYRLRGEELSIYGQMAAIVDSYDAMTSDSAYQRHREPTEALQLLMEKSDRHFKPELIQHFIRSLGIYPVGSLVRLESEHLAVVIEQRREDLLRPKIRAIFSIRAEGFITPKDIDLAAPGSADRIVGFENPLRWKIDPRRFI
ncbi:HDIG domain-containing protein [Methylomagnum ishizawai]|uniref:HDIG domain-containing protein n=1 Tax=Methylomagnum ishizawai TaxID=1760988 RepID=A0A1Y6CXV2_9GAMM|nr:HD-GYP domain-containing protein [Methylomagnum ishizawai]SMF95499.1 HDIG domain-containing protein [Methylomagnum ishizawai]